MRARAIVIVIVLAVLSLSPFILACSRATGIFHQVTSLRGTVLGRNLHSLGPIHNWRWLRQSVVPNAELVLYEYRSVDDVRSGKQEREVERIKADKNGKFDFGTVEKGHYTLRITGPELQDFFDVEVVDASKVRNTDYIVIDISPVYPDCTGGHEFTVRTKS